MIKSLLRSVLFLLAAGQYTTVGGSDAATRGVPTPSVATLGTTIQGMKEIFTSKERNLVVMQVEAALARAQAAYGVIPEAAAKEITRRVGLRYLPSSELAGEFDRVQHRMVALLNVWGRSMQGDAAQYLHYGATTVDIYDTTLVLQLRAAIGLLRRQLLSLEDVLLTQAERHKATVMIGRTLGQHALPITFGKKVSAWLAENRRHLARLEAVDQRLSHSAILKGAVGSYLGLGQQAMAVEAAFALELGLAVPEVADWHGTRDVFAEYALTLALISKSWGRIGRELFLLQMTDIGETEEVRPASAVGSSTMPHKRNPRATEALIQHARQIPRLAEVVLDDVDNAFERDNTSRPNRVLDNISLETSRMLNTAIVLMRDLKVHAAQMRRNLDTTNQLIMAQRLAFEIAPLIGKKTANDQLHDIAVEALDTGVSLETAFQASELGKLLTEEALQRLLDPTTYLGLAVEQTEAVIRQIRNLRTEEERSR